MNGKPPIPDSAGIFPDHVAVEAAVTAACARIAPTWPLDEFIAVNPYWGHLGDPIEQVAASLACLSGARVTPPHAFYLEEIRAGRLKPNHLADALLAAGSPQTLAQLTAPEAPAHDMTTCRLPLITDVADRQRDTAHAMPWREFVTHQISQHCAAWFDRSQAAWSPGRTEGLYASWRVGLTGDHSASLLMGAKGLADAAKHLEARPTDALAAGLAALGLSQHRWEAYLSALLLSVNGWSSWCAYEGWQAKLGGGCDEHLLELLAVRLGWDRLLLRECSPVLLAQWRESWRETTVAEARAAASQHRNWVLQTALEKAYQAPLCAQLSEALVVAAEASGPVPAVQAVFCIDVRSEVFRRALELSSEQVATKGFAGFFGLPIAYNPLGTDWTRPQLPGLLAPALRVGDCADAPGLAQALATRRQQRLQTNARWDEFRGRASSAFTFVEACGLFYGAKLLRASIGSNKQRHESSDAFLRSAEVSCLKPRLQPAPGGGAGRAAAEDQVTLAAGILRAMALTADFARLVLLAGHGSQSANNAHAAGLECGACGGQSGQVNARVLASLLNDPAVRCGLAQLNIRIPSTTVFLAGLHNTTTDELQIFDLDAIPQSHAGDVAALGQWLRAAGDRARAERSADLGIGQHPASPGSLLQRLKHRANNWAEVRPEWGLANNAAFLVAPRQRTRHMNLQGRAFLHDYDHRADTDGAVLELIMTAPMVVTNWINMQYYASTVDPERYGSGNKVLHNVVGGRLGVFEGNGGDLRIGLPLQSVHDGKHWRHTPLRLSVFIEASRDAISAVLHKHASVRMLVEHRWLHLFQIEPLTSKILRYQIDGWKPVSTGGVQQIQNFDSRGR